MTLVYAMRRSEIFTSAICDWCGRKRWELVIGMVPVGWTSTKAPGFRVDFCSALCWDEFFLVKLETGRWPV